MTAGRRTSSADLHVHTTASDGLVTPASLARLASERGIFVLAITDHDTVAGVEPARRAAAEVGVRLIAGVEFSARARRGQTHILGYGIDTEHDELAGVLADLRESRVQRGWAMLERLAELGIEIDPSAVEVGDEESSPGRPHIARALIERGYADSIEEAFDRYLGVGRPAFVPRRTLTAERAIELITNAGGIPVLAHPLSVHDLDVRLNELIRAGLRGLEAYYGEYDDPTRERLARLASSRNLLITGGSDYHGDGGKEGRDLGSVSWPVRYLEAFLSALA